MKLVDNSLIIESFTEAYEAFFNPGYWGYRPGGSWCAHYAATLMLGMEESLARSVVLEFKNTEIQKYWEKLEQIQDICYEEFDFNVGSVIESKDADPRDKNSILIDVAKKISDRGFDTFDFEMFDDDVSCCRAVKVTDIKTNKYFLFFDIEDMAMYNSLVDWIHSENKIRIIESRKQCALEFLKELS